jgi:glycosyltransferase involved in cell wall biosynthesis
MGLPVISTNVGGVTALVHERINGFVVEKSMPGEIAVALRELLLSPNLREQMGEASREIVGQFSLARMAKQVEQIYRKLLSVNYT